MKKIIMLLSLLLGWGYAIAVLCMKIENKIPNSELSLFILILTMSVGIFVALKILSLFETMVILPLLNNTEKINIEKISLDELDKMMRDNCSSWFSTYESRYEPFKELLRRHNFLIYYNTFQSVDIKINKKD